MAVKMQRMNVVAGVAELEPVTAPLMHGEGRLHSVHGESCAIEEPLVEAVERGVMFYHHDLECFVRRFRNRDGFSEDRVVPFVWLRLAPLRLTGGVRIFD